MVSLYQQSATGCAAPAGVSLYQQSATGCAAPTAVLAMHHAALLPVLDRILCHLLWQRWHQTVFTSLQPRESLRYHTVDQSINQSMYLMSWGATGTQQTRSSVQ